MQYVFPWNENITKIVICPTNQRNFMATTAFFQQNRCKQNFCVHLDFAQAVTIFGKQYTSVEYLHDRNSDEIVATYQNDKNEKQKFYPMQSCNFWNDLHILSAPESQLNAEEKSLRLNMAQAISEIECCNID